MGSKDLTEKILEDYNDIFADIINVLVFGKQHNVKPEDLSETSVHSQYKGDDAKVHEQERDIAKIWEPYQTEFALFGIENQTKVDKTMPFRVCGYEGASYRGRLQAEKKPIPVITIILYFGMKRWQAPKTMKEQLNIPPALEEYVNDCKIHVFEIAWLSDEQIELFQSDFKVVARFFADKRKYGADYVPRDKQKIKHVDEVLKLLSAMTGDRRYENLLEGERKVDNMCEVAERLEQKGIEKGIEKGRTEDIKRMLRNGKNAEEIAAFCGYNLEEVKAVEAAM